MSHGHGPTWPCLYGESSQIPQFVARIAPDRRPHSLPRKTVPRTTGRYVEQSLRKVNALIEASFRHRAAQAESAAERHALVLDRLIPISELWQKDPSGGKLDADGVFGAYDLTPFLPEGIAAALSYSARYQGYLQDQAMFDDVLTFQLEESAAIRYEEFCLESFPRIATAFGSYRAAIVQDLPLAVNDYRKICKLRQQPNLDVDGRDTVYRFHPVQFLDRELCRRAFRLEVDQVIARLQGQVEHVAALADGVYFVVTSGRVDRPQLEAIHRRVADLLRIEGDLQA